MAQDLKFRSDSTFKIAQITDVHFNNEYPEAQQTSILLFKEVIENEQPDLVVMTGDIVTSDATLEQWDRVIAPFKEAGVPVAVVLGNHDDEWEVDRETLYKYFKESTDCLIDIDDMTLEIKGSDNSAKALIYLIDSHSDSELDRVGGYGWIQPTQIDKYRATSAMYTQSNGGNPLPALAYFHIPLPEYTEAYNSKPSFYGSRGEEECPPKINTGMFSAMVIAGDVMGCFVGHDHVNDYVAYLHDIALCYGRVSSIGATYGYLRPGSRIVVLHEGERKFDSYIYEMGGNITQRSEFPRKK